MKNFDWTAFSKRIAIKSTLSEIYDAWTVPDRLEKWFLERAVFQQAENTRLEPSQSLEKGCVSDWYWYLDPSPMHGEIRAANGKDYLQFTFEGSCMVEVQLSLLDKYVIVELRQYNIPQDDYSKQHIRLGCSGGWSFYLNNLKSIYEGGIDLRNKDAQLGTMINN